MGQGDPRAELNYYARPQRYHNRQQGDMTNTWEDACATRAENLKEEGRWRLSS